MNQLISIYLQLRVIRVVWCHTLAEVHSHISREDVVHFLFWMPHGDSRGVQWRHASVRFQTHVLLKLKREREKCAHAHRGGLGGMLARNIIARVIRWNWASLALTRVSVTPPDKSQALLHIQWYNTRIYIHFLSEFNWPWITPTKTRDVSFYFYLRHFIFRNFFFLDTCFSTPFPGLFDSSISPRRNFNTNHLFPHLYRILK